MSIPLILSRPSHSFCHAFHTVHVTPIILFILSTCSYSPPYLSVAGLAEVSQGRAPGEGIDQLAPGGYLYELWDMANRPPSPAGSWSTDPTTQTPGQQRNKQEVVVATKPHHGSFCPKRQPIELKHILTGMLKHPLYICKIGFFCSCGWVPCSIRIHHFRTPHTVPPPQWLSWTYQPLLATKAPTMVLAALCCSPGDCLKR